MRGTYGAELEHLPEAETLDSVLAPAADAITNLTTAHGAPVAVVTQDVVARLLLLDLVPDLRHRPSFPRRPGTWDLLRRTANGWSGPVLGVLASEGIPR
jgi:hypothetical protein